MKPRTSLLITTFNRTPLLQTSLERLCQRTLPDEVLIVDDGGSDGCEELCAAMSDRLPMRYIYTHNPVDSQCCHARNVGIKHTDADLIITSEPELLFDTDVIAQMLAIHAGQPADVVSAGTVHHCHPGGVVDTTVNWSATWTALYERQWLLDVGGWDEGFESSWGWDDVDLATRLRVSGHGQIIDQAIEVTHQWHPYRYDGVDQSINEGRFRAKLMDGQDNWDIVANKDMDWGVIKPR